MPQRMPDFNYTVPDFDVHEIEQAVAYKYGACRVDSSNIYIAEIKSLKSGRRLSAFVYAAPYIFEFTVRADKTKDGYELFYTNIMRTRSRRSL